MMTVQCLYNTVYGISDVKYYNSKSNIKPFMNLTETNLYKHHLLQHIHVGTLFQQWKDKRIAAENLVQKTSQIGKKKIK